MGADEQKRAAGEAAVDLIEPGMVVGLGTGSTAAAFVRALAIRRVDIRGVATSEAIADLARLMKIPLLELDEAKDIDVTVDGADEIGPGLSLIKGGGGALLREKLVWECSRKCVVIADAAKRGSFSDAVSVLAAQAPTVSTPSSVPTSAVVARFRKRPCSTTPVTALSAAASPTGFSIAPQTAS